MRSSKSWRRPTRRRPSIWARAWATAARNVISTACGASFSSGRKRIRWHGGGGPPSCVHPRAIRRPTKPSPPPGRTRIPRRHSIGRRPSRAATTGRTSRQFHRWARWAPERRHCGDGIRKTDAGRTGQVTGDREHQPAMGAARPEGRDGFCKFPPVWPQQIQYPR